ncbi:hypothetical protein TNCV_4391011 [Trichonephila clavipes]|nr:hypothetical protein TNCV_4391011 [Trichonephila clavipes]
MAGYEQLLTEFINLPSTFTESWYLFSVRRHIGGYQSPQIFCLMRKSIDLDRDRTRDTPLGVEGQQQTNHATQPTSFQSLLRYLSEIRI